MKHISVKGARTHNLKNIDLDIPRDQLVVITGLSGSGKSSLAFDTLYAEGQRRYVESLSAYARQFLSLMDKPEVDHIEGLSPAISIEQKSTSHNPRSTVGTITEIYDYLRLLFARAGTPHCPIHHHPLLAQTISQMVDQIMTLETDQKIMVLAPVVQDKKGEHIHTLHELKTSGYVRARIDGLVIDLDEAPLLEKNKKHTIEVVVDRLKVKEGIENRLAESLETSLSLTQGLVSIYDMTSEEQLFLFSARYACPECGHSIREMEPRLFSFNNPAGACQACDGIGVRTFFDEELVIQNPSLSLSQGAVKGWDRRSPYYFSLLSALADTFGFDLDTPFDQLSEDHQQAILYGSGKKKINFQYSSDRGMQVNRQQAFEGIIPNLERRYRDTDSSSMREELAKYMSTQPCTSCNGTRLNDDARNVTVGDHTIGSIVDHSVEDALAHFHALSLDGAKAAIAERILREIRLRLEFLMNLGLDYLTLNRRADTLSGGEAQRIRLASQIGAGLVGVMYVLDEPSIGLHQRDNERLIKTLCHLRDLGNSVLVVEHDTDTILAADHIIDIGPGAGHHGGEVIASGSLEAIKSAERSLTGDYLTGRKSIDSPKQRHEASPDRQLSLLGAKGHNLQSVDLHIPIGLFTCITGVSGSGKSTLINGTLYPIAARELNRATIIRPEAYASIEGLEHLDKVVDIDQSPIGRTPRSNPATYTQIFTPIRELFAGTQEARARAYKPGRFSFNVKGGRCEACQGDGTIKVEMHFLPDVYVACDVCHGKRYNRETLEIKYKGKNIYEVLEMTVEDALDFFEAIPAIARRLQTLADVGLNYIRLGQAATTLSGGEAQRVKLAKELSKRDTGRTLYILDEPSTGLHFHDVHHLLEILANLRDRGNTVVVIEHNLDIIKTADWIVDLGPEGGAKGGQIIAAGTPESVADNPDSHTGRFLRPTLEKDAKEAAVET